MAKKIEKHSSQSIDALGGTTAVAKRLGIKPPSVTNWRTHGIPNGQLVILAAELEKKGFTTRKKLRPDDWHLIWPELLIRDKD